MSHVDATSPLPERPAILDGMSAGGWLRRAVVAAAMLQGAACSDRGSACVTGLPAECSPLYPPTFDQIFSRTLAPTCAQPGGVCHASAGVQGGLLFITADDSYAMLLGQSGGSARVVPGNPACSPLVERLESTDPSTVMPPEAPLSEAEKCSIRTWIESGAKR